MNTDLRKAAEQALEALESVYGKGKRCEAAIKALRQALAEPEQVLTARVVVTEERHEPVAWLIQYKTRHDIMWGSAPGLRNNDQILGMEPLYTAPPKREWVGLTDEEMNELWVEYHGDSCIADGRIPEYEKAIEAKLKDKNT